jgi:glutamate-1-semialdehyde aminotransferase
MFGLFFTERGHATFSDATACDERFSASFTECSTKGSISRLRRSRPEPSAAHTPDEIDATCRAARVFARL